MDLHLKGQRFLVTGASSGFGRAVAEALLAEGAYLVLNARRGHLLEPLERKFEDQVSIFEGDIYLDKTREELISELKNWPLHGAFINAGGPPAKSFMEAGMNEWDEAYRTVFRWKIDLLKSILPIMQEQSYGRVIMLESVSVKQAVPNLVFSNAMRMAVAGAVKTLADEIGGQGITINLLGPGYHDTPAVDRVFRKAAEKSGRVVEEVRNEFVQAIPVKRMGEAYELASLATWLLSHMSGYITGQTISVDGGRVRGNFG